MSDPATLWRRRKRRDGDPVIVATGPFVILAHGLLAIPPERRGSFWIATDAGDIRPDEAEALRLAWMRPASAA